MEKWAFKRKKKQKQKSLNNSGGGIWTHVQSTCHKSIEIYAYMSKACVLTCQKA